jgi:ABC-2 type transport system ATP-binding protein
MPPPDHALRSSGLVKRYGSLTAVDGLDLEVRTGECFGLLGPNGAGKTTSVEIFEGLAVPDAGRVEVLGMTWHGHGHAIRQRIGVQLQEAQFADKLTVLETLTLFRSFYDRGPTARSLLEAAQLEEKANVWVRKLSGGQRQRLSVACALAGDPDLVFFDEPTTGLDPQSRRQLWAVLEAFKARGKTVLLTTHAMDEAERLCDRVAIMDRGRIIALDTPPRLVASLGAEHVVSFAAERAPDLGPIGGLPGVRAVRVEDAEVSLTVDHVHHAVPALLAELERQRIPVTSLATHHATLEDVFVSLTGRHLRD